MILREESLAVLKCSKDEDVCAIYNFQFLDVEEHLAFLRELIAIARSVKNIYHYNGERPSPLIFQEFNGNPKIQIRFMPTKVYESMPRFPPIVGRENPQ
jgi:hypothetical protein